MKNIPDLPSDSPEFEKKLKKTFAKAAREQRAVKGESTDEPVSREDLDETLAMFETALAVKRLKKLDLEIAELEDEQRDRNTSHEKKRVYFFTGAIGERDYEWMVKTLSQWARDSKDPITLVLNSPGGYVIQTLAMYDFLRGLSAQGIHIKTVGIGEVASGGGILLQAGDERVLTPNAWMLIHEVAGGAIGKQSEMNDRMKFMQRLQDKCVTILAERSTMSVKEIGRKWKKTDWWLTADESLKLGFCDTVAEGWTY